MSEKPFSPLRRRMIEDMTVRNFVEKTRNDYIRHVKTFTGFLGRSPDTATPSPNSLERCVALWLGPRRRTSRKLGHNLWTWNRRPMRFRQTTRGWRGTIGKTFG